MSVLVIVACLAGVVGSWWLRAEVTGLMDGTEEIVQSGTKVAQDGIDDANRLIEEARQEVERVEEKVQQSLQKVNGAAIAAELVRRELRENLEPKIERMQEQIAPLRDTLTVTSGFVDVLVSVESVRQRALWLEDAQQAFDRLEELMAQIRELAESLKEARVDETPEDAEPVDAVTRVAAEIDGRLVEINALTDKLRERVDTVESDALAFTAQVRWTANISAVALTLILAWIVYSQRVMIGRLRGAGKSPATR